MGKLIAVLEDDKEDFLVVKVEIMDYGVTIYGRARDGEMWAKAMAEMIKVINPPVKAHDDEKTRSGYHPNGSPKKRGEYYFHHVHVVGEPEEVMEMISKLELNNYLSKDMKLLCWSYLVEQQIGGFDD